MTIDHQSQLKSKDEQYQRLKTELTLDLEKVRQNAKFEMSRLTTELNETRVLYRTYEDKYTNLNSEFQKVTTQYQELKIEKHKLQLTNHELEHTVSKLHTEISESSAKLSAAHESMKEMSSVIRHKDAQIASKESKIDEVGRQVLDLEREKSAIVNNQTDMEKQFEMTEKGLNNEISNYVRIIESEKETSSSLLEQVKKYRYELEEKNKKLHTISTLVGVKDDDYVELKYDSDEKQQITGLTD